MKVKTSYLYFAGALLILMLWLFLFFLPLTSKAKEKKEVLRAIRKEMEMVDRQIADLLALRTRQKEVDIRMEEIRTQLPTIDGLYDLIKGLVLSAKRQGLEVEAIQPLFTSVKELEGKDFLYPIFEVTLKGRFLQMGRFLEELEKSRSFRGISKAKISYDEHGYPLLKGKIVLQMRVLKEGK